jgi:predicted PurR-regulated permease PerM
MSSRQKSTRKIRRVTRFYPLETVSIHSQVSPPWSSTVKLVAGLSLVALAAWLLLRFRDVVGVLLVAILLAYLLYPLTDRIRNFTKISWRFAATLVFLISVIILLGLITLGGLAIVDQAQSLIGFLSGTLGDLPRLVDSLPKFQFGTFHFPPSDLTELGSVGQQLLGMVQPILNRTTSLLTAVASGAASVLGWTFFTLLVSYFILAESKGIPNRMFSIRVPVYGEDFRRFGKYLAGIWNAFLRGQLTIILITILVYIVLLSVLGVHYALGLALLAGLARFVPYVGPLVAWTSYGLVAYFQGFTPFGIPPLIYVLVVVGCAWLTDLIMDNFVSARLMGNALKIHPAAVMVSAIIGVNLLGLIGVMLAAPVLATCKLFFEYVFNKLLDRDPWEGIKTNQPPVSRPLRQVVQYRFSQVRSLAQGIFRRLSTRAGS